ncbi:MAG TPA: hypothetical protein VFG28_06755 [Syntrophales bacterium]|nr:hypothetical protein [Syntrophales bacterium]
MKETAVKSVNQVPTRRKLNNIYSIAKEISNAHQKQFAGLAPAILIGRLECTGNEFRKTKRDLEIF